VGIVVTTKDRKDQKMMRSDYQSCPRMKQLIYTTKCTTSIDPILGENNNVNIKRNPKKLFVNPKNIQNLETINQIDTTNKRIPIIIHVNETDIIFTTNKRKEKIEYVLSILNNNESYTKLFNFINNQQVVCAQISQPNTNSSYKKHITDVVNASITNTPYSVDLVEKYKDKNNWQLFIDNREKRLCFVIWSINEELY